jgi:hypothetical protein
MDEKVTPQHEWSYCKLCDTTMVLCGTCGNNTCNGGYGTLPDGSTCPDCQSAYEMMYYGWKKEDQENDDNPRKSPADS